MWCLFCYSLFLISPPLVPQKDIFEPAHEKTYNKTCVISKVLVLVHPPRMARVRVHPSLYSPESLEGTCDQRRL